jgi:hypothetical protein
MALFPISAESQTYVDGEKNARADILLARKSDYAWFGENDLNPYTCSYSKGYRDVIPAAPDYDRNSLES